LLSEEEKDYGREKRKDLNIDNHYKVNTWGNNMGVLDVITLKWLRKIFGKWYALPVLKDIAEQLTGLDPEFELDIKKATPSADYDEINRLIEELGSKIAEYEKNVRLYEDNRQTSVAAASELASRAERAEKQVEELRTLAETLSAKAEKCDELTEQNEKLEQILQKIEFDNSELSRELRKARDRLKEVISDYQTSLQGQRNLQLKASKKATRLFDVYNKILGKIHKNEFSESVYNELKRFVYLMAVTERKDSWVERWIVNPLLAIVDRDYEFGKRLWATIYENILKVQGAEESEYFGKYHPTGVIKTEAIIRYLAANETYSAEVQQEIDAVKAGKTIVEAKHLHKAAFQDFYQSVKKHFDYMTDENRVLCVASRKASEKNWDETRERKSELGLNVDLIDELKAYEKAEGVDLSWFIKLPTDVKRFLENYESFIENY